MKNRGNSVAAAVAAALAGASGTALAQNSTNDEVTDEIVVSGIRHAIETSIAAKREATSIVEAVSAEDIGKLPDTSIADSIARLPGLAAQRIEGRPAAISIRGLGEDYAGSLLNGRQVVSSSEGRSAEYDQFPSELVNQVMVYKTVDAGVVGQGLSGTIDIRPLMPLSLQRRQIGIGARVEQNSNGGLSSTGKGEYGSRFSASYVDQFAEDKIGISLGFARLDSPGQAKKFGSWGIGDYNAQWGSGATGIPRADGAPGDCFRVDDNDDGVPDFDCSLFPQGFESSVTSSKQERDGAMGVLQFKPNDRFSSVVDLYYSKFTQDRTGHHWTGDIGLWSGGAQFTDVQTSDINGNTAVTSATIGGAHSLVYDKNWNRTDKIRAIGWRNELNFADDWKGTLDFGYSRADRDETYIQSVARANSNSSFSFTTTDSQLNWSSPQDLTDPTIVKLTNDPDWSEMRTPKFKDEIKSAQFSVNHNADWGWISGMDVGVAYNQRDKDVSSEAFRLVLADPVTDPESELPMVIIPDSALRDPVRINVGGIQQDVLSWSVPDVMSLYNAVAKDPWLAQTNKFQVHEKVTTGFVRFPIGAELGSVPVRGNVGVQYVRSEQNSDGFAWNSGGDIPEPGAVVPVSGGDTYNDVLPSLNLAFDLRDDLILRFGLGKTMARPRMDDMRAGADQPSLVANTTSPDETGGHWEAGGGGKPDLQPWRAKAVDLSLEKYFEKRSYIAVAGFLKKLDSFIYQRTTERDFSGFVNYSEDLTPACPISAPDCDPNIGQITTQDNGSGGKVYGIELSFSMDFGMWTPSLDGFGVVASASKTYDDLPDDENGDAIKLDGFSGNVNSVELYFERSGFSARVSRRYRSAFTATTRSVLLNTQRSTQIDAESQIDAQIGYDFNSGPFQGMTVLLQGNNLTNEAAITRQSSEVGGSSSGLLPWEDDNYGRVIMLGVSYKIN